MTDSTGGNGQQSLPTLSVGLRTVSALVSRENQELEIPTPPTSPPISTATSNSCPLPRGATISRIASNSVQPSSTTAVGEVIQGLGDGTQKILEAFIKADETEFENLSDPLPVPDSDTTMRSTPATIIPAIPLSPSTSPTTARQIFNHTSPSTRPSLQRASTSPEQVLSLANRLAFEQSELASLYGTKKPSSSTAIIKALSSANSVEEQSSAEKGLREKRRRRQSSDSRGGKSGKTEIRAQNSSPISPMDIIGVVSRPPLHTYTSFQSEFSCPAPPSPAASPNVSVEKTWWRNL